MDKNVSLRLAVQHAVAASLRPITEHLVYKTRSGIAAGLKRKGGLGFMPRHVSDEEQFFMRLAPSLQGKTVYDIGSYEGVFSAFFARAIGPEGTLVIFEPNPECQAMTSANLKLNGFRFQMEPVGLGNQHAKMVLTYPSREPARSTLDAEIAEMIDHEQHRGVKRATVNIERLDDLMKARAFKAPDFLKIDTEGAELEVVRGAEDTIRQYHPAMYIEMHGADMKQKMALQRDLHELLHSWGYEIEDLAGHNAFGSKTHVGHILCTHPAVRSHIMFLGFAPRVDAKAELKN
jgi:FkbM family methyltransferase